MKGIFSRFGGRRHATPMQVSVRSNPPSFDQFLQQGADGLINSNLFHRYKDSSVVLVSTDSDDAMPIVWREIPDPESVESPHPVELTIGIVSNDPQISHEQNVFIRTVCEKYSCKRIAWGGGRVSRLIMLPVFEVICNDWIRY